MTLEDFYTALSQTPRRWRLEGGAIRMDLPVAYHPFRDHDLDCAQCPWTYLDLYGKLNPFEGFRDVDIFRAADNYPEHDPAVRARLLQACGLEEAK